MPTLDTTVFVSREADMAEADVVEQLNDFHADADAEVTDEQYEKYSNQGVGMSLGARTFVWRMTTGDLTFGGVDRTALLLKEEKWLLKLYDFMTDKGRLSPKQERSAVNILRRKMFGHAAPHSTGAAHGGSSDPLECFSCGESFADYPALEAHKVAEHPRSAMAKKAASATAAAPAVSAATASPSAPEATEGPELPSEGTSVLEDNSSELRLDISVIPDGRYALPRMTEGGPSKTKTPYIYLAIRTVLREVTRRKRYRFSKFIKGNEKVPAGTIEVKEWSSDQKRLCGEQHPSDKLYRGEFEKELDLLMTNPEPFAILFGQELHHCCRCGKKLTDEISKNDGVGPECVKHVQNGWFQKQLDREKLVKEAAERAAERAKVKAAEAKRREEVKPAMAKLGEEV